MNCLLSSCPGMHKNWEILSFSLSFPRPSFSPFLASPIPFPTPNIRIYAFFWVGKEEGKGKVQEKDFIIFMHTRADVRYIYFHHHLYHLVRRPIDKSILGIPVLLFRSIFFFFCFPRMVNERVFVFVMQPK